jgi:hypothetical protein
MSYSAMWRVPATTLEPRHQAQENQRLTPLVGPPNLGFDEDQ